MKELTEAEYLANYDLRNFPPMALTADIVLFTIIDEKLSVLLIKRGGHPEKGKWALPGGFVNPDESPEEAVLRELKEETNISEKHLLLEQLGVYAYPGRDPRGYIASVAYVGFAFGKETPIPRDDAIEAKFFSVQELLQGNVFNNDLADSLAFDHSDIFYDAFNLFSTSYPLQMKFLK